MAEMTTPQPARPIRPTPEKLREMPTLGIQTHEDGTEVWGEHARQLGVEFKLELKLVTPEEKYWLCTQGSTDPNSDVPRNWIVGNVTIFFPDGGSSVYGPDDVATNQKFDYLKMLREKVYSLSDAYEKEPTNELWKAHKEALREFDEETKKLANDDSA